MPFVRQASFVGGQISAKLYGRSDLPKYTASVRKARNFFVSPHGSLLNRPGTQFIRETKESSYAPRLIPFIYSDEQSYVLEFGNLYLRFHSNGGTVISGGVPYEIVTTFTTAQLPFLKFAQVGDVMTLVTKDNANAYELKRLGHTNWTLTAVSFAARSHGFGTPHAPAARAPLPTPDATHPAKPWVWKVTMLKKLNGVTRESAPYTVINKFTSGDPAARSGVTTIDPTVAVYPDMPVTISWNDNGLLSASVIGWRIYRGQGSRFGLIGEVDAATSTTRDFVDFGDAPDYSQGPPQGRNPFDVYSDSGVFVATEQPSTVAFFEERRVFGGTLERPGTLFFSNTGDYSNFDNRAPSIDEEAVVVELASRKREEIRWIVGTRQLIVGTNGTIWSVGGAAGDALTYASIQPLVHSEIGASWLDPLIVNNSILYTRAKGYGVRDLLFDERRGAYGGADLSFVADDLFEGDDRNLIDWTWQEDPYGTVWAVRSDGVLLSLAYNREQGLVAWSWHDTPEGAFEAICAVPETTEDGVYVIVRRSVGGVTKRYIERLNSRRPQAIERGVFLDSALSYDSAPATVFSGLTHLEGRTVSALADGDEYEGLVVSGGAITLPREGGASVVHVGLPYECDLETLDIAPTPEARVQQKTVTRVIVEVDRSRGLWVGETEDQLTEWRQRTVLVGYGVLPLSSDPVEIRVSGNTWNRGGRVFLRHKAPTPLNIIAVTREVELGGA